MSPRLSLVLNNPVLLLIDYTYDYGQRRSSATGGAVGVPLAYPKESARCLFLHCCPWNERTHPPIKMRIYRGTGRREISIYLFFAYPIYYLRPRPSFLAPS